MNKKFIWILILILVIIASGVIYFLHKQQPEPFAGNSSCEEMYNEIENDINDANYCEIDSDCDVLMLGGQYVDFGCYHFVNNAVDKDQFYKKMDVYEQKCSKIINLCAPVPDARCVSNKCIYVEQE